jgi:hypothetical protein
MWMTEDGQTHSAAFNPWTVLEGRELIVAARGLSREALESCRERVERLFSDIDEPVSRELSFSEAESDWEGTYLPHEWLRFLRREIVLAPEGLMVYPVSAALNRTSSRRVPRTPSERRPRLACRRGRTSLARGRSPRSCRR